MIVLLGKEFMNKSTSKDEKAKGFFIVRNDRGLHTRPSTEIVRCATSFKSEVRLCYQKTEVNAKSLLGILMLAAGKGARIRIEAIGDDAEQAVASLMSLASQKFNISY